MSNKIFLVLVGLLIFFGSIYIITYEEEIEKEEPKAEKKIDFSSVVNCLEESGVVIYGTRSCPACNELVENFGGYENINPIYIDCSKEWKRCIDEMLSSSIPEVQIDGSLFQETKTLKNITREAGCDISLE